MVSRKKMFVITLIITIISFFIIKSPISLIPLIYIILTILITYIYLYIIKKSYRIEMDKSSTKEFQRLSSQIYFINITNKSFLVFPKMNLEIALQSKEGYLIKKYEYDFLLNPKESKQLEINVEFPHIGEYVFKILEIKIYDIFNMFYLKIREDCEENIFVVPKKYDIEDLDIETIKPLHAVNFNVLSKMDGEIYDDIREYLPGDSMKNIHWKLSAHTNKYMTRILTTDAVNGITVYIDRFIKNNLFNIDKLHINDALIESAYTIGLFAMKKDRQVNYIYPHMNSPLCSHTNTFYELESTIFELSKSSKLESYPFEILLSEYGNSIMSLDNMVIITSNINESLINMIIDFKGQRKKIFLCFISLKSDKNIIDKDTMKLLIESDIEYHIVQSAKDLSLIVGGGRDA